MKILKGEEAALKKKGNMAMWDDIDGIAEECIRQIAERSEKEVDFDDFEDELVDLYKEVVEKIVTSLEKDFGAEFVYADCNY